MASARVKTQLTVVVVGIAALASAQFVRASGPWFEEAPPTLPFYLHRLPAKTLQQIADETGRRPPAAAPVYLGAKLPEIASRVGNDAPAKLVGEIDDLLRLNRAIDWTSTTGWYGGSAVANLLHDVRDLLSATPWATATEFVDYITWRIDRGEAFGIRGDEPRSYSWDRPTPPPALQEEIEQRMAVAPATLRPHWLYLHAAVLLRQGRDTGAVSAFPRTRFNLHESHSRFK